MASGLARSSHAKETPEKSEQPPGRQRSGGPPRVLELQGFREFGKGQRRTATAARCWRSFTAPDLPALPAGTRQGSESEPGTIRAIRASGAEGGLGPQEGVLAATAPPVGLSAPPTPSEAGPGREKKTEEEERSEPSPGALRDRVPAAAAGQPPADEGAPGGGRRW